LKLEVDLKVETVELEKRSLTSFSCIYLAVEATRVLMRIIKFNK